MTQPSMIAIQDEFIAKILACRTGHIRRVRIAARETAEAKLVKLGFSAEQARAIINDALDMAELEAAADF